MKKYLVYILIVAFFTACSTKVPKKAELNLNFESLEKKEQIFSAKKAKEVSIDEAVSQIEPYEVIFVGDHHNTKKTHEFFNQILEKLAQRGYTIHLANEWFSPSHNKLLEDYTSNKIDSEGLKKGRNWDKFTSYDWNLSKMLYETVKNSNGKLYGVNITKADRKKISLRKFDEMNAEELAFYKSLDLNVDPHKSLVSPYFSHCKYMPTKSDEPCEDRMYRVQVTWDTYMAKESYKLSQKVLKTKKDKLIVFAGAFHMIHEIGIPLRFARLSNKPFTVVSNHKLSKETPLKIHKSEADILFVYE